MSIDLSKPLLKFVGIFSGFVTIIAFALYLAEKSIHYATEFILLAISLFLLIIILRLRQNIIHLTSESSIKDKLYYEHLGLTFFTNPDTLIEDDKHRFLEPEEQFDIIGKDAFFSYRFQGLNASDSPSRFIRDRIVDDIPIHLDSLGIEAIDNQSGNPLQWKVVKNQTYAIIVEYFFTHPLSPGDSFDISFSYKLLGSFTRKEDYVFFPQHIYKKGTNKFKASLSLELPPIYYELLRFDGRKFTLEEQPELEISKNKATIKWETTKTKDLLLLKFV